MKVVFTGRRRTLWRIALANPFTIGIRRRVWLVRVNQELDGHASLGLNHGVHKFLAILPIIGPLILHLKTVTRIQLITSGVDGVPRTFGVYRLLAFIPLVGTTTLMTLNQWALNRYWPAGEELASHGVELELQKASEKGFKIQMAKAVQESRRSGSRLSTGAERRRAYISSLNGRFAKVRVLRQQVREAGGSTPLLPWVAPELEPTRDLHITCGSCELKFDLKQNPYQDTPVLCPRCGQKEVLPALGSNQLQLVDHGLTPTIKVNCPDCKTKFHTVRFLDGPTPIKCWNCGKQETLPAPTL